MSSRAAVVGLCLVSAVASAGELRARAIERGLEEPGKFGPANLFDGKADTAWCAPAGSYAHVTYAFYEGGADADALAGLRELEVSAGDAEGGAREVTMRVYDAPGAWATATATVDPANGKSTVRVPLVHGAHDAIQIEIDVTRSDKQNMRPLCLNEVVLRGAHGALALPGLSAAAETTRARDRVLATAKRGDLRAYLGAFSWIYLNPHKKTSTWESARYDLRTDGTFTRTVHDLLSDAPVVTTGSWTLRGDLLLLGGLRVHLGACRSTPGYLCGSDAPFVPVPAE